MRQGNPQIEITLNYTILFFFLLLLTECTTHTSVPTKGLSWEKGRKSRFLSLTDFLQYYFETVVMQVRCD